LLRQREVLYTVRRMRTPTPRATPVAAAPPPGSRRDAAPDRSSAELRGPTLVVWRDGQYELTEGSLLIGRSHECELLLTDSLVSRLHARVRVEADRVGIEDLHSTNGVYLRGDRIAHFATLREGDRVLIGTHEISFFRLTDDAAPESGVGESTAARRAEREPPAASEARAPAAAPTTARAAALEVVGNLARRFATEGRAEEAANVLIPHLKRILRGANSGLEVPRELREQASQYALDVAVWTADAAWLDYVIELHVATKSIMMHSAILAIQRAERWLGAIDRVLLQYYIESCSSTSASLDEGQQMRLRLLERLLVAKF
jgi:pSer/pThr/pTyr-binding forkhead associated (FHA) protein